MKKRLHLYISGKVQGVTFRHFTMERAYNLKVNGWVKNRDDGKVEAVLEGDKEGIDELLELLKKGPGRARVDDIKIEEEEHKGEFETFDVIY